MNLKTKLTRLVSMNLEDKVNKASLNGLGKQS